MASSRAALDKERHIKYWKRCHKSLLPTPYTSADSTRVMFACFIVCALDLLESPLTKADRSDIRSWVLSLQHPDGGFCGSSTHAYTGRDATRGSANLAATFFALVLLVASADGEDEACTAFSGVSRHRLLRWLRKLQRDDGSFGQNLWQGSPVGGSDMRHSYLASCIRWMLRTDHGTRTANEEDVNVETMVEHIRRGQTYDGGLAESSENESHGGYAYCGVAALAMLDRDKNSSSQHTAALRQEDLIKFLAQRQFPYLAQEEEEDDGEESENLVELDLSTLTLDSPRQHVGYNGRWNKKADTCYCWWTGGALKLLDHESTMQMESSRGYLLDITQHRIGGFSKTAGGPPDIYHSYLGLACLALMGQDSLKDFDVGLCCSTDLTHRIALARDGPSTAPTNHGWEGDGFWDALAQH